MKQWQAPKLIVLTRSKPEEAVLSVCKGSFIGTTPQDIFPGCAVGDGVSACSSCEAQTQS